MIDLGMTGVAVRNAIQIDAWRRAQPVRGADEGIKPGVSEANPGRFIDDEKSAKRPAALKQGHQGLASTSKKHRPMKLSSGAA